MGYENLLNHTCNTMKFHNRTIITLVTSNVYKRMFPHLRYELVEKFKDGQTGRLGRLETKSILLML